MMNNEIKLGLWIAAVAAVVTTLAAGAPARAQDLEPPRGRQGYYVGLGLHGVALKSWENGQGYDVWGGSAYSLRLGQLLTQRLGLGLQIDLGGARGEGQMAGLGALSMEASWNLVGNLAVHAATGVGFVQLTDPRVEDEDLRGGAGGVYTLSVSYDTFPRRRRLTGGWAVTPTLQLRFLPSEEVDSITTFLGVQVVWWSGRPREQLQLPDSEAYKRR